MLRPRGARGDDGERPGAHLQSRNQIRELIADREWVRANQGATAITRGFKNLVSTIPEMPAIEDRTTKASPEEDLAAVERAFGDASES